MSEERKEADSKSNFIPSLLTHFIQGYRIMMPSTDIDPCIFIKKNPSKGRDFILHEMFTHDTSRHPCVVCIENYK